MLILLSSPTVDFVEENQDRFYSGKYCIYASFAISYQTLTEVLISQSTEDKLWYSSMVKHFNQGWF